MSASSFRAAVALGALSLVAATAFGANVGNPPSLGTHHYAIVNLDVPEPLGASALILRGTSGTSGIVHDLVVLAPTTRYREWILNPRSMRVASVDYTTPSSGNRFTIPDFILERTASPDSDGDGVHDLGEFIVGTDSQDADSDDDGILDGMELRNGTNPLDGRPAAVGLVAAQDTPGNAVDVAVTSGLAAVADRTGGVVLFDVSDALHPVRAAQVDTPGDARAVAFGPRLLAVADGTAGLAIVNVFDPPAAFIASQLALGAPANAVVTDGPVAYVGLNDGHVVAVDLPSATVLERKRVTTSAIQDVLLGHEALYVLVAGTLYTVDLRLGELGAVASVSAPGSVGAGLRRLRLNHGGGILYSTQTAGVNAFSLGDPLAPTLLRATSATERGWKQLVPNGSGIAVAAVDPNSTDDGVHDISLYTLADDGSITFRSTIATPGLASAVAIHNGLAFVADGGSGLQIANYLAYDSLGQAPTIALSASFPLAPDPQAEEGKRVRISATVSDDVQVRNVEFFIDGQRVVYDGGYPFEARVVTPLLSATKTSFTLQARATDTGGNRAESPLYTVALVPDATPPFLRRTSPVDNAYLGQVASVLAVFNEPLLLDSVSPASFLVRGAGADGVFLTGDDPALPASSIFFRQEMNGIGIQFSEPLATGKYRIEIKTTIADLAGNTLAAEAQRTFTVLGFVDQDQDGVSDALELSLGLDPGKPDTDGDGIVDGLEDFDGDGLSNALEALYGTALNDRDTDFDNLSDSLEITNGTNPIDADTDDDSWTDGEEIKDARDPKLASSVSPFTVIGRPTVLVDLFAAEEGLDAPAGAVIARPPVVLDLAIAEEALAAPVGAVIARPPVALELAVAEEGQAAPIGAVIARPPVDVQTSIAEEAQAAPAGAVVGRPPTDVTIQP